MTFLSCMIVLLMIGFVAHVFYWQIFRKLVLTKFRYRIFAARDRLRLLLIKKEIGESEPAYGIIEGICNCRIAALPHISLSAVVFSGRTPPELELLLQRDAEIINAADPALRAIAEDVRNVIFGACVINSPTWFPIILVVSLLMHWSAKAKRWWNDMRNGALRDAYFKTAYAG